MNKVNKLINKKIKALKQIDRFSWGLSNYGKGQLDMLLELKKELYNFSEDKK